MRAKFKKFGCYVIIIILLPYVVTVFLNGPSITSYSHVDETYVKVRVADASGDVAAGGDAAAGTVVEMPIEEYCVGVLAKEIPASYEKEALKAQAILVRTDVYKKIKEFFGTAEQFWAFHNLPDNSNKLLFIDIKEEEFDQMKEIAFI